MRIEYPLWLWGAMIAAIAGAFLVVLWHRRRRMAQDALGSSGMLERLTRVDLTGSPQRRGVLIAGALGLMGFALAGPQWGAQEVEEQTRALSVVLAMDISESMWAEDLRPNRLERQRLEARRLVNELTGHRVGLVAFAGSAYLMSPLTIDHGALHLYLDTLDPTMAGTPGSSLAAAIREALELLRDDSAEGGDRAIVVLSDGESHDPEDAVLQAAREAESRRIKVYGIGVGRERGEPIPLHDRLGERVGGYKRDSEDNVVLTRLTREPLSRVADVTGGFWARADESGVARVLAALSELERGRSEVLSGVRWTPRFQWFVAAALLLLLADWTWAWRRRR
ncbi:MAG: VWA domain-containing protein [Gemmatimonadales bacterium]